MPPSVGGERHHVLGHAGPLTFKWRDISTFSGGISMKLGTNIHHVSGHWWKCFQGQRSKVKVIARPDAFSLRMHVRCVRSGVEALIGFVYIRLLHGLQYACVMSPWRYCTDFFRYMYLLFACCFLVCLFFFTACFWRNKDAYNTRSDVLFLFVCFSYNQGWTRDQHSHR